VFQTSTPVSAAYPKKWAGWGGGKKEVATNPQTLLGKRLETVAHDRDPRPLPIPPPQHRQVGVRQQHIGEIAPAQPFPVRLPGTEDGHDARGLLAQDGEGDVGWSVLFREEGRVRVGEEVKVRLGYDRV